VKRSASPTWNSWQDSNLLYRVTLTLIKLIVDTTSLSTRMGRHGTIHFSAYANLSIGCGFINGLYQHEIFTLWKWSF
jgi:hypothetical protein